MAVPFILGDGGTHFRFDSDFHLSALFEAYLVTILVGQRVLDAKLSIQVIGPFHCDLSLLRYARRRRLDNLFDSCGQSGAWLVAGIWFITHRQFLPSGNLTGNQHSLAVCCKQPAITSDQRYWSYTIYYLYLFLCTTRGTQHQHYSRFDPASTFLPKVSCSASWPKSRPRCGSDPSLSEN